MKEIIHVMRPSNCMPLITPIKNRKQENFGVILLNGCHDVIGSKVLFKGGLNRCMIDPRLIFHYALKHLACAMVVYHNHPSGNCLPSEDDIKMTEKLKQAGEIVGIQVLDHIIIPKYGYDEYFSFLEHDLVLSK